MHRCKRALRSYITFWRSIGASQFIIDKISRGYVIPFLTTPPAAQFNNHKSALEHKEFVNSAIMDLIKSGFIVGCPLPPTVVNPLSVATQSSGKKRLILDLRYPNSFLTKCKLKFEGVNGMLTILPDQPQYFAFLFDI